MLWFPGHARRPPSAGAPASQTPDALPGYTSGTLNAEVRTFEGFDLEGESRRSEPWSPLPLSPLPVGKAVAAAEPDASTLSPLDRSGTVDPQELAVGHPHPHRLPAAGPHRESPLGTAGRLKEVVVERKGLPVQDEVEVRALSRRYHQLEEQHLFLERQLHEVVHRHRVALQEASHEKRSATTELRQLRSLHASVQTALQTSQAEHQRLIEQHRLQQQELQRQQQRQQRDAALWEEERHGWQRRVEEATVEQVKSESAVLSWMAKYEALEEMLGVLHLQMQDHEQRLQIENGSSRTSATGRHTSALLQEEKAPSPESMEETDTTGHRRRRSHRRRSHRRRRSQRTSSTRSSSTPKQRPHSSEETRTSATTSTFTQHTFLNFDNVQPLSLIEDLSSYSQPQPLQEEPEQPRRVRQASSSSGVDYAYRHHTSRSPRKTPLSRSPATWLSKTTPAVGAALPPPSIRTSSCHAAADTLAKSPPPTLVPETRRSPPHHHHTTLRGVSPDYYRRWSSSEPRSEGPTAADRRLAGLQGAARSSGVVVAPHTGHPTENTHETENDGRSSSQHSSALPLRENDVSIPVATVRSSNHSTAELEVPAVSHPTAETVQSPTPTTAADAEDRSVTLNLTALHDIRVTSGHESYGAAHMLLPSKEGETAVPSNKSAESTPPSPHVEEWHQGPAHRSSATTSWVADLPAATPTQRPVPLPEPEAVLWRTSATPVRVEEHPLVRRLQEEKRALEANETSRAEELRALRCARKEALQQRDHATQLYQRLMEDMSEVLHWVMGRAASLRGKTESHPRHSAEPPSTSITPTSSKAVSALGSSNRRAASRPLRWETAGVLNTDEGLPSSTQELLEVVERSIEPDVSVEDGVVQRALFPMNEGTRAPSHSSRNCSTNMRSSTHANWKDKRVRAATATGQASSLSAHLAPAIALPRERKGLCHASQRPSSGAMTPKGMNCRSATDGGGGSGAVLGDEVDSTTPLSTPIHSAVVAATPAGHLSSDARGPSAVLGTNLVDGLRHCIGMVFQEYLGLIRSTRVAQESRQKLQKQNKALKAQLREVEEAMANAKQKHAAEMDRWVTQQRTTRSQQQKRDDELEALRNRLEAVSKDRDQLFQQQTLTERAWKAKLQAQGKKCKALEQELKQQSAALGELTAARCEDATTLHNMRKALRDHHVEEADELADEVVKYRSYCGVLYTSLQSLSSLVSKLWLQRTAETSKSYYRSRIRQVCPEDSEEMRAAQWCLEEFLQHQRTQGVSVSVPLASPCFPCEAMTSDAASSGVLRLRCVVHAIRAVYRLHALVSWRKGVMATQRQSSLNSTSAADFSRNGQRGGLHRSAVLQVPLWAMLPPETRRQWNYLLEPSDAVPPPDGGSRQQGQLHTPLEHLWPRVRLPDMEVLCEELLEVFDPDAASVKSTGQGSLETALAKTILTAAHLPCAVSTAPDSSDTSFGERDVNAYLLSHHLCEDVCSRRTPMKEQSLKRKFGERMRREAAAFGSHSEEATVKSEKSTAWVLLTGEGEPDASPPRAEEQNDPSEAAAWHLLCSHDWERRFQERFPRCAKQWFATVHGSSQPNHKLEGLRFLPALLQVLQCQSFQQRQVLELTQERERHLTALHSAGQMIQVLEGEMSSITEEIQQRSHIEETSHFMEAKESALLAEQLSLSEEVCQTERRARHHAEELLEQYRSRELQLLADQWRYKNQLQSYAAETRNEALRLQLRLPSRVPHEEHPIVDAADGGEVEHRLSGSDVVSRTPSPVTNSLPDSEKTAGLHRTHTLSSSFDSLAPEESAALLSNPTSVQGQRVPPAPALDHYCIAAQVRSLSEATGASAAAYAAAYTGSGNGSVVEEEHRRTTLALEVLGAAFQREVRAPHTTRNRNGSLDVSAPPEGEKELRQPEASFAAVVPPPLQAMERAAQVVESLRRAVLKEAPRIRSSSVEGGVAGDPFPSY